MRGARARGASAGVGRNSSLWFELGGYRIPNSRRVPHDPRVGDAVPSELREARNPRSKMRALGIGSPLLIMSCACLLFVEEKGAAWICGSAARFGCMGRGPLLSCLLKIHAIVGSTSSSRFALFLISCEVSTSDFEYLRAPCRPNDAEMAAVA